MKTSHLIHAHMWPALFCLTTMTGCNFQDTGLGQSARCTSNAACEATQICSIEGECVTIASLDMMTDQQVLPVQGDMPADMDVVSPLDLGDLAPDTGEDLEQADMVFDLAEDMSPSNLSAMIHYTLSSGPMEFTATAHDTQGGFFATGRRFRETERTTDAFVTHITPNRSPDTVMFESVDGSELLAISARDNQAMAVGHFHNEEISARNGLWTFTDRTQKQVIFGRHGNLNQQDHRNQAVLAVENDWMMAGVIGSEQDKIFIARARDNGDIIQAREFTTIQDMGQSFEVLKLVGDESLVYALIQAKNEMGEYESILAQFNTKTLDLTWAYRIDEPLNIRLYDMLSVDGLIITAGHVEDTDDGITVVFDKAGPNIFSANTFRGIHMTGVTTDGSGVWLLGNTSTEPHEAIAYRAGMEMLVMGLRFSNRSVPTTRTSSLLFLDKQMTAVTHTPQGVVAMIPMDDTPQAFCGSDRFGTTTTVAPEFPDISGELMPFKSTSITIQNQDIDDFLVPEQVRIEGSSPSCSK